MLYEKLKCLNEAKKLPEIQTFTEEENYTNSALIFKARTMYENCKITETNLNFMLQSDRNFRARYSSSTLKLPPLTNIEKYP